MPDEPIADLVRNAVRANHEACDQQACALAHVWADDVSEVLEVAERIRRDRMSAAARRLAWAIYLEGGGVGTIVTDLDTEEWASGSARTEEDARGIARRRLDETPSGGSGGDRGQDADLVSACRAAVLRPGDVPSHLVAATLDELVRARSQLRAVEETAREAIRERDSGYRGSGNLQGYELHELDGKAELAQGLLSEMGVTP